MLNYILLCPPDHFSIDYEINPWMHTENKVNPKLAMDQFSALKSIYDKLEIPTKSIDQVKGLPDMVYTANFGFAVNKTFIPAQFKFAERQPETQVAIDYFFDAGYAIKQLPEGVIYEGEGDHLMTPDGRHFMGYGKRTQKEAATHLSEILESKVTALELVDPYFYHLDTAFCPLTDEIALVNPRSFTEDGMNTLEESFSTVIKTSEDDNKVMAPNLLRFGNDLVMAEGITDTLKTTLESHGFKVHTVNTSEFLKGGGSIKCLSMQVYD